MSELITNLNNILDIKGNIKSAIENKGVDMTGVSFSGYASKIGEITTSFVTVPLNVSANGTYTPGEGVDGYSQVVVDVPASGWDQKSFTEGTIEIINLDNSASFVVSSAFKNNKTIQTVNLPYATTVGHNAFQGCSSLNQVSLSVCSSIGSYAFGYCSSLSIITIGYSSICSLGGSNAFSITPIASGTGSIYVPASLVDSYKSASYWSYFSTQIFPIPE